MAFHFIGGIEFPIQVSVFACFYMLGRVIFTVGYLSSPRKRVYGVVFCNLAAIALFACSVLAITRLIKGRPMGPFLPRKLGRTGLSEILKAAVEKSERKTK